MKRNLQNKAKPKSRIRSRRTTTRPAKVFVPGAYCIYPRSGRLLQIGAEEAKYFDLPVNGAVSLDFTTAQTYPLTDPITQGSGATNRIGNSITVAKINCNFTFTGSDAPGNTLRFMLVQWHDYTIGGFVPALSDVLSSVASVADISNFIRPGFPGRFSVLHDCLVTVTNTGYSHKYSESFDIKLKTNVWFDGALSNSRNGIYVMMCSDSSVVAHPTVNAFFRVQFYDD